MQVSDKQINKVGQEAESKMSCIVTKVKYNKCSYKQPRGQFNTYLAYTYNNPHADLGQRHYTNK